eukprot:m.13523 g.13523  ORF g.13523 m.13523 type:complete len:72 (-) comp7527_c0_seq1:23-238(-)
MSLLASVISLLEILSPLDNVALFQRRCASTCSVLLRSEEPRSSSKSFKKKENGDLLCVVLFAVLKLTHNPT